MTKSYKCTHCNQTWSEDSVPTEVEYNYGADMDGNRGMDATFIQEICPVCHCGYIEEAKQCDKCGEIFFDKELDANDLCEDCQDDIL